MGFLEDMASKAVGEFAGGAGGQQAGLAGGIMQMLNSQPGGIAGLVQNFHDKGLGGVVNSWVSTGQNLPISAEQIQSVLGNTQVAQLAAKAGISPEVASSKLAELLPVLVDHLTPNGTVPQGTGAGLLEQGLNFLRSRA